MNRYVFLLLALLFVPIANADSLNSGFQTEIITQQSSTVDQIKFTFGSGMQKQIPINYEAGNATHRKASIIADPTQAGNKVLKYWMKYAKVLNGPGQYKGRIQMSFMGLNETAHTYSLRMYLHPDLAVLRNYPGEISWFTVGELWVGRPTMDPYPFRISINIGKAAGVGQPLLLFARGLKAPAGGGNWTIVWLEANTSFEVPTGQWMGIDVGYQQGDQATGRFTFDVDGVPILDVTNWTYHPDSPTPVPLVMTHPLKLYTSDDIINYVRNQGKVAQIYWDDLVIPELY